MTNRSISRRRFLAGLGAGAAATVMPFVPILEAEAQPAIPKRLLLFITGNGVLRNTWVPTDGAPSESLMPLERHWSKLAICASGIEQRVFVSGGEGRDHVRSHPQLLTGRRIHEDRATAAAGISIDHHVAATIGPDRPFPVLHLGAGNAGAYSFTGANAPFNAERDPGRALERVFADVGSGSSGPSPRDMQRRHIVDMVRGQLGEVRSRVGRNDQLRIDAHVSGLDEVQRQIDALASLTCATPDIGPIQTSYEHAPDLQAQIAAAAMACDLTRVSVVTLGNSGNVGLSFPWLGINRDAHDFAHAARGGRSNGEALAMSQQTTVDTWHAERFAHLLDRLAAYEERDGSSLLDHTVVAWVTPIAQGNHSADDMPFIVAGGGITGGRVLNLGDRTHNEFLLTLAHAVGLSDATFGEPEFCSGPIAELLA